MRRVEAFPGRHVSLLGLLLVLLLGGCAGEDAEERPPNLVIVFTDDQGYADVGVYGAEGFATPNFDKMARKGMRFTDFYMAASVCTPARAALLTGSYPQRVGMTNVLGPKSTTGLSPEETTIAGVLRQQGYATAAIGKWHLGDHPKFLPTNHGFDTYFGIPYSNDMSPDPANNPRERARRHPPLPLLEDTTVVEREPDQRQLTRRYTERAVEFIEENQGEPFFLYLAHAFPHVPLYASERFEGTTERGLYGDVVREIDWSVGQLLETLDELDLEEQTLVVFTSDNGPWLVWQDHAGSAAPLREGKGTTFEGGHRVPFVARWPGRIPEGTVSGEMATAMDLLPTFARLAGAELPEAKIDGKDIWPLLSGEPEAESPYEAFYYYRGQHLEAVRSGRWKLHVPHSYRTLGEEASRGGGQLGEYRQAEIDLSLFDVESDPGERENVAEAHPDVVERLLDSMHEARLELGDADSTGAGVREPGQVEEPWHKQVDVEWQEQVAVE